MAELKDFALYPISWDLTPEDAVTLYLEWGNNDWQAEYPPVRSKEDVSYYFVLDSWQDPPLIRLIKRNSETAEDLVVFPLPEQFREEWNKLNAGLKGISTPPASVKSWLKAQLGQEKINS